MGFYSFQALRRRCSGKKSLLKAVPDSINQNRSRMKYAKWIFVVLLISSLTSFVEKDKPTGGLNVGDMAPDFKIQSMSAEQSQTDLSDLKGKYVLLSFWASYDAQSRMQNASLSNALRSTAHNNVKMVSVSFDEYQSIFEETIRKDQIVTPTCFVETKGEYSGLFKNVSLGPRIH